MQHKTSGRPQPSEIPRPRTRLYVNKSGAKASASNGVTRRWQSSAQKRTLTCSGRDLDSHRYHVDMQHAAASLFCALVLALSPEFQVQAARLPNVHVLATGGTIAGAQTSTISYEYKPGTY